MKPPRELAGQIEQWLHSAGCSEAPAYSMVGGGCISPAAQLSCGQQSWFIKWANDDAAGRTFAAEREGLIALAATGAVRTPAVEHLDRRWLVLEWLPRRTPSDAAWADFGGSLARMHKHSESLFGWHAPNFIGALEQTNEVEADWPTFWRDQRLRAQLAQAPAARLLARDRARFDQLFERLPDLLAVGQLEGPSLLHGDLWSGNAHPTQDVIALIDPSVYYGHREVDLAMTELFGGFPAQFRSAYDEEWPLERSGFERRRAIYQLYYLLVHVNMFGEGYLAQTRQALNDALS